MNNECESCKYFQPHYNLMDGEEFMGCDKFFWEKCLRKEKENEQRRRDKNNLRIRKVLRF